MFKLIKKYFKRIKCNHEFEFFCGFEVQYYKKGLNYCGELAWIPYHGYYKEIHCKKCGKSMYLNPLNGKWYKGSNKKYWISKTTWCFAEGNLD